MLMDNDTNLTFQHMKEKFELLKKIIIKLRKLGLHVISLSPIVELLHSDNLIFRVLCQTILQMRFVICMFRKVYRVFRLYLCLSSIGYIWWYQFL